MSATAPGAGAPPAGGMSARTQQMLHAPVVATLFRLATPNVMGLFAMPLFIAYDGFILGRIGADALAGVALVFPLSMLMMQMSAGGMGGAVTGAVARALGAGRGDQASRLAQHAVFIAIVCAALFTLAQVVLGRSIYAAMGGRGAALAQALAYSNVLFGGALVFWVFNVLASILRGSGNMLLPSVTLLAHGAGASGAVAAAGVRLGLISGMGRRRRRRERAHRQRAGRGGDGTATVAPWRRGAPSSAAVAPEHRSAARHPARGRAGFAEPGARQFGDRRLDGPGGQLRRLPRWPRMASRHGSSTSWCPSRSGSAPR